MSKHFARPSLYQLDPDLREPDTIFWQAVCLLLVADLLALAITPALDAIFFAL